MIAYLPATQIMQQMPSHAECWLRQAVQATLEIAEALGVDPATVPPQTILIIALERLKAACKAAQA
jgi:hypothetical protein